MDIDDLNPFVSDAKEYARLKVCESCPLYNDHFKILWFKIKKVPQCDVCGCTIKGLTSLKLGKCELNKWD